MAPDPDERFVAKAVVSTELSERVNSAAACGNTPSS